MSTVRHCIKVKVDSDSDEVFPSVFDSSTWPLRFQYVPKSLQFTCRDASLIIVLPQWPHVNVQFSFASVLSGTDLFYCFVVRVACGACLHTEGTGVGGDIKERYHSMTEYDSMTILHG